MAGDCPVDGDFLHVPSFLAVVAAFQDGRSVSAGEARRAVGCVGEFLGQFLCRLAVTDVVAAVTVGGDGIQAIIAQAAGDKHDFSRRSNSQSDIDMIFINNSKSLILYIFNKYEIK